VCGSRFDLEHQKKKKRRKKENESESLINKEESMKLFVKYVLRLVSPPMNSFQYFLSHSICKSSLKLRLNVFDYKELYG
jgi:hypothetical protein